jgi:putative hydrolase of the HAD superfamily
MSEATVTLIGLDADDTLWQNEMFFRQTEDRLLDLLADFGDRTMLAARLLTVEKRNVAVYGFGIKGFTLSMVETALEVSDGRVPATLIGEIVAMGREMLSHPVELLPDVRQTLETLAHRHPLVLITKGDLFDQERKLAQSGLIELFKAVEIVSDKSAATYARIFSAMGDGPSRGLMVGNSLRSDILPALEAGAFAVHVPHALTWAYEHVEEPVEHPRLYVMERISSVVDLIEKINENGGDFTV